MEKTTVDTGECALDGLTAKLRHLGRVATQFTERRDVRQHTEQAR